jgi:hypothetical protein
MVTHSELLAKGGVYAQLHRIQFALTANMADSNISVKQIAGNI